jgi:hypothetical protein
LAAKDKGALLEQPEPVLDDSGEATPVEDSLSDTITTLLAEMPFTEVDELRNVVTEGRERGYVTPEEIAVSLEEVDASREQVTELHQYLVERTASRSCPTKRGWIPRTVRRRQTPPRRSPCRRRSSST